MVYFNKLELNNKAGISSSGISRLCISISSSALRVKKNLDEINNLIDDSSFYFNGDTRDDFIKKFKDIIVRKKRINDNILSYVDDYNSVVKKFSNLDSSIVFNNDIGKKE